MNIDNMTFGELKQISAMFSQPQNNTGLTDSLTGKMVIVRSRNEGVNFGEVIDADDTGIILKNAIRIWYHKPKNKNMSWYEGVAVSGLSECSKISTAVPSKTIIEDYSATECTEDAVTSILGHKAHEQN